MRAEADAILAAIPTSAFVIAMDERGEQWTSVKMSKVVEEKMVRGTRHVVFIIGGADGLDPKIRDRADKVLALSKMTLTHEMARMFLVEQIYRSMTIIRGEPYHRV